MHFSRHIVAAAVLLASVTAAQADNANVAVTLPTTVFTDTTPFTGSFIDIKSYTGLADGAYNFTFILSGFNLNLLGVTFDGAAVPFATSFGVTSGALSGSFSVAGAPVLLALAGTAGPGAAYTGILNVSAVPEPETYAMLLAGLGALGMLARRRQQG